MFAAAGDPEVLATLLEAMQGKKVASFAEGLEAGAELLIPHCRGPLVRTESGDTQTDSERSGQEVTRHSSFRTSGSGPNTALEEAEAEERRRVFVERGLGPLWHSLRDALAQGTCSPGAQVPAPLTRTPPLPPQHGSLRRRRTASSARCSGGSSLRAS